jgi:hypothetical protein
MAGTRHEQMAVERAVYHHIDRQVFSSRGCAQLPKLQLDVASRRGPCRCAGAFTGDSMQSNVPE